MKVRVTKLGYYNHKRQKPGVILKLASEAHFSEKWMSKDLNPPKEDEGADDESEEFPLVEAPVRAKGGKRGRNADVI